MKNRKIVQSLAVLNKREIRGLQNSLQCSDVVSQRLLQFIIRFYPTFNQKNFTDETAWKHIYPNKKYSRIHLNKICHKLLEQIEFFIITLQINQQNFIKLEQLFQFYFARQAYDLAEHTLQKMERMQNKQLVLSHVHYANNYCLEELITQYQYKHDKRQGDLNFKMCNESLDTYYILHKLIIFCNMLTRQRAVNIQYRLTLHEEIISHIKNNNIKNKILIRLWYTAFLMLFNKKVIYYQMLKELLAQHSKNIDISNIRSLYVCLKNMTRQLYDGTNYYEEMFTIYQDEINNNIIYIHEMIHHHSYKNIVNVSIELQKFNWLKSFIESHKNKIAPQKFQEQVYNLNLAKIHFAQQQYNEVLSKLRVDYKYSDVYWEIDARRMEIKVYYELKYLNILDDKIHAFKNYLIRKKDLSDNYKLLNKQFIKHLQAINNIHPNNITAIQKAYINIKENQAFPEKEWILKKVFQLNPHFKLSEVS